jgi:myo-inositol-1-phosphate synthase
MNNKIRVGIVGMGNNASALIQGIHRYARPDESAASEGRHGIRFPTLCGYAISDIEFSCGFDVDVRKIGLDLTTAIFSDPNCYPRTATELKPAGARVAPAPVLDGVPPFLANTVSVADGLSEEATPQDFVSCVDEVCRTGTEVLVNFLPSGSDAATTFFARVAAEARAAYINCTPSPAVHSPEIEEMFTSARLPLLGDDLESQFGSSLLHRTLLDALESRGLEVLQSYQVNLGGNTDFRNLTHRGDAKKLSKRKAISTSRASDRVDILPSGGFVRGLGDNKVGYIVIEGRGWLDMPVTIDVKLKVQDSSNAAGVVVDLIRLARAALDRGHAGYFPAAYYFKNPLGEKPITADALEEIKRIDSGEAP